MTAEMDSARRRTRLRRLELIYPHHPIYFVTACTEKRRGLLSSPAIHQSFVAFAAAGQTRGAWVGRYVLMPDHLHLFVALDDGMIQLSMWMKSLKNALSKTLRASDFRQPYWQKGFFDHVLRSGESSSEKWEYVRENPIRAGLVTRVEDWAYQGEIHALEFRRS